MKTFKNNFVVKFVLVLFLIGFVFGLIYNLTYKPDLSLYIERFKVGIVNTRVNTFLLNMVPLFVIFLLSFSIIGLPLVIFYIFFESFSIGYTLVSFINLYNFKGAIFYILYLLFSKIIYIIILLYFTIMSIRCTYRLVSSLIHKNKEQFYNTTINHFVRFIIILVLSLANSTLIYFFANKIISLFINLISK